MPIPKGTAVFILPIRRDLRRQLAAKAVEAGTSMRGFVHLALKAQGLDVRDDEIIDRRLPRQPETVAAE
jgi:hypothetical protein